jgi:F0F1-type ATP synthase assembly protein I
MGAALGVMNRVAIVVILIIGVSLGLGILLDRWLETDRLFTLLFILGSIPLTLTAVYRISMATVSRIQADADSTNDKSEEETAT